MTQYCKDCENTHHDERFRDKPLMLSVTCPWYKWLADNFYLEEFDSQIHNPDLVQPPPNCNCFKPRHVDETDFVDIKETMGNTNVQREGQS